MSTNLKGRGMLDLESGGERGLDPELEHKLSELTGRV